MAPIDKDLIDKELLSNSEVSWLNNYHSKVYKNLKKFMSRGEQKKLSVYCSKI